MKQLYVVVDEKTDKQLRVFDTEIEACAYMKIVAIHIKTYLMIISTEELAA